MKIARSSFCLLFCASISNAAITLSGPSNSQWVALDAKYDFLDEQWTDPENDIVGNAANPGFLTAFDDAGTPSLTDGSIGFRVRLDGYTDESQLDNNLWIGIDADLNGSVDAFVGLHMQGSNGTLGIYSPGTDGNTTPKNTSIISEGAITYPINTNYSYRAVNYLQDGGTTNDLTTSTLGDTDYYVSCMVSFADVIGLLNTKAISINEHTPIRYMIATSTHFESLNQDIGGADGGVNETKTWDELNAFSSGPAGQAVPECSATLLAFIGSVLAGGFRRRR